MSGTNTAAVLAVVAAGGLAATAAVFGGETPQFWAVAGGSFLYIAEREHRAKRSIHSSSFTALTSVLLAYGLCPWLAVETGRPKELAFVVVAVWGQLVLSLGGRIISDTAFWKRIVADRLGKDGK